MLTRDPFYKVVIVYPIGELQGHDPGRYLHRWSDWMLFRTHVGNPSQPRHMSLVICRSMRVHAGRMWV
ncbi:unnamed protein product [Penicillium camemberti]|uniref:Str. FM013 n=1 Tax=Penicillium camemberti (strain FM 013) TaxID=1429867 RepID=A0A0G4P7E2_PENC3|nr:unnamed protein product [Penicillium camemberti]